VRSRLRSGCAVKCPPQFPSERVPFCCHADQIDLQFTVAPGSTSAGLHGNPKGVLVTVGGAGAPRRGRYAARQGLTFVLVHRRAGTDCIMQSWLVATATFATLAKHAIPKEGLPILLCLRPTARFRPSRPHSRQSVIVIDLRFVAGGVTPSVLFQVAPILYHSYPTVTRHHFLPCSPRRSSLSVPRYIFRAPTDFESSK
jgi:hypothetical protein